MTRIEVSNAIGEWLQVAQVQALGGGSFDYALASNGATASATSQYELTGVVPEPSTWALLILGFGIVGAALRGRRTRPTYV